MTGRWRIVRTNRSLRRTWAVPPVALVGEAGRAIARRLRKRRAIFPARFAGTRKQTREEYVAASSDRIFLVSTSRTSGANEEDIRTIHVLKDITDRREAERRYRELFDSIQEGLFFATPDGRFLDVNDAMVRMLGYSSREELLRDRRGSAFISGARSRERFLSQTGANWRVAQLRRNAAPQRWHACCTLCRTSPPFATRSGQDRANSRVDAGRDGTTNISVPVAAANATSTRKS